MTVDNWIQLGILAVTVISVYSTVKLANKKSNKAAINEAIAVTSHLDFIRH